MFKINYIKKSLLLLSLILVSLTQITYAHNNPKQKILFVLSAHEHGYWLSEVLTPYKILTKAGFNIDFATPDGAKGVQTGIEYIENDQKALLLQLKTALDQPKSLKSIDTSEYAGLYVAGGAGPMFDLFNHSEVNRITASMYENNKPVSAVCHGPAAFAAVRLSNNELMIHGKNVTGKANAEEGEWARNNYPFMLEDKLSEKGKFSAAAPGEPWVVQDDNLLTGQNPASAGPLALKLIEMLKAQH